MRGPAMAVHQTAMQACDSNSKPVLLLKDARIRRYRLCNKSSLLLHTTHFAVSAVVQQLYILCNVHYRVFGAVCERLG